MAEKVSTLKYELNKDSIKFFDEIMNIELRRKPSDLGFTEQNEMMASPRRPLIATSTIPAVTQNCSNIFFYTDKNGVNRAYRVVNSTTNSTRSHNLQYATVTGTSIGTWTDITAVNFSLNAVTDYKFNVVKTPTNNSGALSTIYFITVDATIVDRVPKNAGDPEGSAAVGKILLIWSGVYQGIYSAIDGYDTVTGEYILAGSGVARPFTGSTDSYAIYDSIQDILQVYSSQRDDLYVDGITYRSELTGLRNNSLRQALVINTGEFCSQQIFYQNRWWVFKNGTISASGGVPQNPFYYSFIRSNTIINKVIKGMTVYKNRLIVYGDTFVYAIDQNFKIEKLSDYYGVRGDAIVETGDDMYFISTNGKIVSMNEADSGSLYIKNIADIASLYTEDFISDTFAGADDRRIYFGGRVTSGAFSATAIVLVYDLVNKYWSTYATPALSGMTTFGGVAFFRDAILPCHRVFNMSGDYFAPSEVVAVSPNLTVVSATEVQFFIQKLSSKWYKGSSVFNSQKTLKAMMLDIENVASDQAFVVRTFRMLNERSSEGVKRRHTFTQIDDTTTPVGEGESGIELTGGSDLINLDTNVPRFIKEAFKEDFANMIKFSIETEGDGAFYLNAVHAMYSENTDNEWFNPTSVL